jgi:hypothetical protein
MACKLGLSNLIVDLDLVFVLIFAGWPGLRYCYDRPVSLPS